MDDEILEQEAREFLKVQGLDDMSVDMAIEEMRDAGMFKIPGEWIG